jgi:dihydrodipicolinate synthase/N-acetylneuraminate lyase
MTDFPFPGLKLALTTPFDAGGRIDFGRLEENLERYLALGIPGFVLSSGTGMHVYLSKEKSKQLGQRGSKIINGLAKIVERTRHAADCGVDGVMVLPPFFEGPTDDQDGVLPSAGATARASKATASGIAAAEMMLGYNSELTQIYRRFPAPKALPPRPFTTIGAKANLAFRQWKAGAE